MGLRSWWQSLGDGIDAGDMAIDAGIEEISDESLYALAEKIDTPDPETFVESVRYALERHEEDEWMRENGNWFQKFDHGVLIDEDEHPILKKCFPF